MVKFILKKVHWQKRCIFRSTDGPSGEVWHLPLFIIFKRPYIIRWFYFILIDIFITHLLVQHFRGFALWGPIRKYSEITWLESGNIVVYKTRCLPTVFPANLPLADVCQDGHRGVDKWNLRVKANVLSRSMLLNTGLDPTSATPRSATIWSEPFHVLDPSAPAYVRSSPLCSLSSTGNCKRLQQTAFFVHAA